MSGICGLFEFGSGEHPIDEKVLVRMRDALAHRGPDGAGSYLSPDRRVGIGHRRLATLEPARAGAQPASNRDRSIWIAFDGALDDPGRLGALLEPKRRGAGPSSEAELLVQLYEQEGAGFVERLDGMFALCVWDARRRELLLARDRLGIKPLYYAVLPGLILFASEIKAILCHARVSRRIDLAALYHYLTFVASPAPRTLFQGIHKLPPATRVIVDRQGELRAETYWDPLEVPAEPAARYADAEYCAARLRDLLQSAVTAGARADGPVGVLLSGGLDSSALVAFLAAGRGGPPPTFSVGFKDHPTYNEFEYARQVATLFRTEHHEVAIGPKDLLDYIPELIVQQDEPIADWVCVPLHSVAERARAAGTVVIQLGEGSDEQLFGYETFRRAYESYARYFERLMKVPRALRSGAYGAARGVAFLLRRGGERLEVLRKAAREEMLFWGGAIAWSEAQKRRLLSEGARARMEGLTSHAVIAEHYRRARHERPEADFGQLMSYLELKNRVAELVLMRVDKITMGSSIEARLPFLDRALVEFAQRVPTSLKLQGGQTKFLLKKAMQGILPEAIIHRPKQHFRAPVAEWFRGALYGEAMDGVLGSRLREEDLFDYDHVRDLFGAHRSGRRDHSRQLWTLYNLSRWYDYWIAERKAA